MLHFQAATHLGDPQPAKGSHLGRLTRVSEAPSHGVMPKYHHGGTAHKGTYLERMDTLAQEMAEWQMPGPGSEAPRLGGSHHYLICMTMTSNRY